MTATIEPPAYTLARLHEQRAADRALLLEAIERLQRIEAAFVRRPQDPEAAERADALTTAIYAAVGNRVWTAAELWTRGFEADEGARGLAHFFAVLGIASTRSLGRWLGLQADAMPSPSAEYLLRRHRQQSGTTLWQVDIR